MTVAARKPGGLYGLLARDPLWLRDWRASSRLARTPWLIAGTGVAMMCLLLLVAASSTDSTPPEGVAQLLFHLYFGTGTLFVLFFGPAIAASSIAVEREGKTWEALLMAGLAPRKIDRGKFWGAYTHLALYLLAMLPAAALPHWFGTVSLLETLLGVGMLFVFGALAVRVGLLLSAVVPSTRVALLATLVVAAALCLGAGVFGFGLTSWLTHHVGMDSLDRAGPVFWPTALVRERLSFDSIRYLIVLPLAFGTIAWVGLRELAVAALTPDGRGVAPLRKAFLFITPGLALALGLCPHRERFELAVVEVAFCAYLFLSTVILGGEKGASGTSLRTSTLLFGGGVLGLASILGLGAAIIPPSIVHSPYEPSLVEAIAMNVYGLNEALSIPLYATAFLVFLLGAAATLRGGRRSPLFARGLLVALTVAIAFVPLLVAVLVGFGLGERQPSPFVFALSPFVVAASRTQPDAVLAGATFWTAVGAFLLVRSHRREKRALREQAVTPT